MAAGGGLNVLIQHEMSLAKSKSQADKKEAFRTAAIALEELSDLALRMGFKDAAKCHAQESSQMQALAQGRHAAPARCRAKVYSDSFKEMAVSGLGSNSPLLDELTKTWATEVWVWSGSVVRFDALKVKKVDANE